MPSKRQPSKQRRAAQNRAARAALQTRKVNANRDPDAPPPTSTSTPSPSTSAAPSSGAALPGAKAALLALLFAVGAGIAVFLIQVRVDADGEPLTSSEIKEADKDDDTVYKASALDAYGAVIFVVALAPIAATGFGYQAVRTHRSSRWLLGALAGLAIITLTNPLPLLLLPAMGALVFAQTQVRKAERLQAAAEGPAPPEDSVAEDSVIDVDEVEDEDRA